MSKILMPHNGPIQQRLEVATQGGDVILRMQVPCEELIMNPQAAMQIAKALANAARDQYLKHHASSDYSLDTDKLLKGN